MTDEWVAFVIGDKMLDNNHNSRTMLKRPSLFVIKGILETIQKSPNHQARFSLISYATPELRNKKKLKGYLSLLLELDWLRKENGMMTTPYNPLKKAPSSKRVEMWYSLTDKGRAFLELFPD